jgi:uncharacterized glyoxalase superfamily protein PhnB
MAAKRRRTTKRASRKKKKVETAAARPVLNASGLAPEMQAVNTYLAVANVNASIQFLEKAFGFTRGVILPGADGQPRYAEMRHGDSVVMLIPKGDSTTATGGAAALYTYVGDVDKALTKARAAGAGVSEAEDRPWGDRTAIVTDADGYRWVLATFKKLVPFS